MITTTPSFGFSPRPFKPVPVIRSRVIWVEDFFAGEFDDVSENDDRLIVTNYEFPIKITSAVFDSRFGGCNVSLRWNGNLVHFTGVGAVVSAPISPAFGEYTCSQDVPVLGELRLNIFDVAPLYNGSEIVDWHVNYLRPRS